VARFRARLIDLTQQAHVRTMASSDLLGETVDGLRPFANALVEFEQQTVFVFAVQNE
jgi:hypothetical protein